MIKYFCFKTKDLKIYRDTFNFITLKKCLLALESSRWSEKMNERGTTVMNNV